MAEVQEGYVGVQRGYIEFSGVMFVFRGVMLGFRRVIFGSEGLYWVQWGYMLSIQSVDHLPAKQGRR